MSSPACTGPCDQGRKPCPSPTACRLPSGDDDVWEPVTGAELAAVMFWPLVCIAGVVVGSLLAYFR